MTKIISALAVLAALSTTAIAADLSLKAPAAPTGYAAGGCGMYYGLNAMGAANGINGADVPGAVVAQGAVGVTLGYGCPMAGAGAFWFAEGNFDVTSINGDRAAGMSLTGPAHLEQRVGFGGPIATMLNLFPGFSNGLAVPSLPLLPAGVTAGTSYPFLFAAVHEKDVGAQLGLMRNREWMVSPGFGIGLQTRLSNGVVAETAAQWVLNSNGVALGPQKVTFGNGAEVSFTLKY